eukprot:2298660-Rhodomonas_salina.1
MYKTEACEWALKPKLSEQAGLGRAVRLTTKPAETQTPRHISTTSPPHLLHIAYPATAFPPAAETSFPCLRSQPALCSRSAGACRPRRSYGAAVLRDLLCAPRALPHHRRSQHTFHASSNQSVGGWDPRAMGAPSCRAHPHRPSSIAHRASRIAHPPMAH